jgi:hypothetical protein
MPESNSPEPYTLYIDESGDSNLLVINTDFPLFVLCGVLVSRSEYQAMRQALNELKIDFCDGKHVILHSRDIRKQTGAFTWLQVPQRRQAFYTAINAVVQAQPYQIVAVAVRKAVYVEQFGRTLADAYALALSALLENAVLLLSQIPAPPPLHLIFERRGRREDQELARNFQHILNVGTAHLTPEQLAVHAPTIDFRPKSDNLNGHQLADLLAYPIARHVLAASSTNPAFNVLSTHLDTAHGLRVLP